MRRSGVRPPSAPPPENSDRLGLFCTFGRVLPDYFWGRSSEDETAVTHRNFRSGLKARATRYGIPTQIVWPRTIEGQTNKRGKRQDPATRAWNLATALYHKAGGVPWRLHNFDPGVCFVGVSFYRESAAAGALLRTSVPSLTDDSQIGADLRVYADEENRAHFDQRR